MEETKVSELAPEPGAQLLHTACCPGGAVFCAHVRREWCVLAIFNCGVCELAGGVR